MKTRTTIQGVNVYANRLQYTYMETSTEKMVLTQRLVELLEQGFHSDNSLAQKLGVNTTTVRRYKPHANEIIRSIKIDRSVIRNLQIQRVYKLVDGLTYDLENAETAREKHLIHSSIVKYCQHLALITGLNVESMLNVDPQKLVIIRPPKIVQQG
jgi:hypothetical protein